MENKTCDTSIDAFYVLSARIGIGSKQERLCSKCLHLNESQNIEWVCFGQS